MTGPNLGELWVEGHFDVDNPLCPQSPMDQDELRTAVTGLPRVDPAIDIFRSHLFPPSASQIT
jgi:hypothetical protein